MASSTFLNLVDQDVEVYNKRIHYKDGYGRIPYPDETKKASTAWRENKECESPRKTTLSTNFERIYTRVNVIQGTSSSPTSNIEQAVMMVSQFYENKFEKSGFHRQSMRSGNEQRDCFQKFISQTITWNANINHPLK